MKLNAHSRSAHRRGTLLLEVVVAAILVAAAMLLVGHSTRLWLAQQQYAAQQRIALLEASNLLERLTAQATPLNEASTLELSAAVLAALPNAEAHVALKQLDQLTRIEVSLDWQLASGARSHSVKLVTWARPAPAEESQP